MARAVPTLLGAAVLFTLTLQVSVAGEFRDHAPQIALRLLPADAEARSKLAASLVAIAPSPQAASAAVGLAHNAIRRDPLNPVALRALGLANEATDKSRSARDRTLALFQQGEKLSRRDAMTQFWLVEYYLEEGQIADVMNHFDYAMRTTSSGREILFPTLVTAAARPEVADALIARARQRPAWFQSFANFLLDPQVNLDTAAKLARATLDPKRPEEREVIDGLLQRLAAAGENELAWQLYSQFRLGGRGTGTMVADGTFDSMRRPPPFGWSLTGSSDLWAARERHPNGTGSILRVFATAGKAGDAARQLLRLLPGSYQLAAEFGDVPVDSFARPVVNLRCARENSDSQLGSLKPSRPGSVREQVSVAVPANCPFQWLTVTVSSQDEPTAEAPWVDNLAILRQ